MLANRSGPLIGQALAHGANIINISGGELASWGAGEADPLLAKAIRDCVENNVLVIAAAGNDGCACQHVPAALPDVLAVGALREGGPPMEASHWGSAYRSQGILVPGEHIVGAAPGGGTVARTGTSYASPLAAGIAALFMSLQWKHGGRVDAQAVRAALLRSARPCIPRSLGGEAHCEKYLAGVIDVSRARMSLMDHAGEQPMHDFQQENPNEGDITGGAARAAGTALGGARVQPSECGCKAGSAEQKNGNEPALVYALGELVIDFPSEARRDSFTQAMGADTTLLKHLGANSDRKWARWS
ncbi:S8 family serine peptidase [Polyangium sp. 15x6]|uniref:S8 family serine peptidase n=1 Tax=Polyangium sp. 15x6 TaxID=3042687 RepID=UPI00249CAC91|nr:S8 family serine peptidase [Polyangium sp. 15x6]MDI3288008.1 S8 family serine peptidase [Polyangium sp. 15x6]